MRGRCLVGHEVREPSYVGPDGVFTTEPVAVTCDPAHDMAMAGKPVSAEAATKIYALWAEAAEAYATELGYEIHTSRGNGDHGTATYRPGDGPANGPTLENEIWQEAHDRISEQATATAIAAAGELGAS